MQRGEAPLSAAPLSAAPLSAAPLSAAPLSAAPLSAADLRSDLARFERRLYEIAPAVKMHPTRLGMVLRGKLPLTPELAARIRAAIRGGEPRSA